MKDTIYNFNTDISQKDMRLDHFLNQKLEHLTRSYIKKLIKDKQITIYDVEKLKAGYKLKGNEEIIVNIPKDKFSEILPQNIAIKIVYEDTDLAIINKQPNLVVHPAPGNPDNTLVNALLYHFDNLSDVGGDIIRPGIVHRLDKDTSGLIIIAKNNNTHNLLVEMFKNREIKKKYLAIVKGEISNETGRIENLIGRDTNNRKKMTVVTKNGKVAITNYRVLDRNNGFSLVQAGIETGRMHQIRVHMKYINHPVLGDELYGRKSFAKRQMLHSYCLEFVHPISKTLIKKIGEIPEDFEAILNKLFLKRNYEL